MKQRFKEMFTTKAFRAGGYSVFAAIILIAIVTVLSVMTDKIPARFTKLDMTRNKLYSLSDETKNTLKSLDKDVNIYIIAQSGSENELLKNTLDKYKGYSDKIKLQTKDPIIDPNFVSKYTSEKASLNSVIVECGAKSRYIAASDMFEQQYSQDYSSQTQSFNGESKVTNAIRAVSEDTVTKLYVTNGHGERELDSAMEDAVKQNNIETDSISLVTADKIPDDASCILIYEPQSDISSEEADLIDEYVTGGGNLLVFTGYTGEELPNVNALMQRYGAEADNGLVVEGDSQRCVRGYNHYIVPNYGSTDITAPLSDGNMFVLAPIAQAIRETDEDKGTDIEKILTTSSKAYIKRNITDGSSIEKESGDESGTFTLGVAITKTTDDKKGHIVWYSGSQMLESQVNQIVSGGNQDLFLNSVNWMCERNDNITIHAKELDNTTLTVSTGAGRVWSFIFVFAVPVLVIALGVYIWRKRRNR